MRNIKLVLWLVVIGLVALVVYQNSIYFTQHQVFALDVPFVARHFETPSLPNAVFLLFFFSLGLLTSFFLGLAGRLRTRREMRSLKTAVESQMDIIAALKKELELVKGDQKAGLGNGNHDFESTSENSRNTDRHPFDTPQNR